MQLDRWKNTALAAVAFAFAVFGVWDFTSPIDQQLTEQLIQLIFIILGSVIGGLGFERVQLSKVSLQAVDLDRIRETVLAFVSFAFSVFSIWQLNLPVDEALVTQFFAILFTILGLFFGGTRATRLYLGFKLKLWR